MLHSLRISQGKASLCSRYVKTNKYTLECAVGFPLFPSVFSGFNGLTASAARGALSATRILTGESDFPYSVKLSSNGDIETLGRYGFDGKLFMSMTTHPKIDSDTDEAFAFRYGLVPPFLTYFRFDKNGVKQLDVPIFSMTRPSFLHDFAITKKYAIFADIQIGMNPLEMIEGGSLVGSDLLKVSRIGVIPRYAKDES
ncbi:putative carotenoid cleavage dioxygenase 4 [Quercus suber]|uniref:Carotenoid cleavage dioxygenase 4 n=1 Tax=Quercus suber TaxID=58331 RepID=A0AAW0K8P9_QUESU